MTHSLHVLSSAARRSSLARVADVIASAHHEAIWEALPEGLEPEMFAPRLAFLLERVEPGRRVLDVGCGEGRFAAELQHAGAEVVAADVAEEPLRRARAAVAGLDARLISPAGPWPFDDAGFDVVWAGEVLEHVADTAAWLSEARRVLRPHGRLLLTTPGHPLALRLRLALSGRAFARHFDPLGDHLRFYTRPGLRLVLERFGFERVEVRALRRAPLGAQPLAACAERSRY
jgi:2-polyprenyl-3-methyl-5-hydroxy-6-metoxy-1,4-benzoquinol methylase